MCNNIKIHNACLNSSSNGTMLWLVLTMMTDQTITGRDSLTVSPPLTSCLCLRSTLLLLSLLFTLLTVTGFAAGADP